MNKEVEIYYAEWCPYCRRALALLKEKGVNYTGYDVDSDPGLREKMTERCAGTTIPQIFIDRKHIGGSDDLVALEDEGRLDQLLKKE
ncbi:glutaredoxin 3 [Candidatus Riflebacteria bacterium]